MSSTTNTEVELEKIARIKVKSVENKQKRKPGLNWVNKSYRAENFHAKIYIPKPQFDQNLGQKIEKTLDRKIDIASPGCFKKVHF